MKTRLKDIPANTNGLHLGVRELLCVLIVAVALVWGVLPSWHRHALQVTLDKDFRFSYALRDDYLLYRATVKQACQEFDTLFLGDSVIWGMYVRNDSTLTACLNRAAGEEKYGNLAIDGLHPVAMETLLRNYAGDLCGKKVYLYLNPLWLNTPLYDLSGEGETSINHPRLLPQFDFSLKCYHGTLQERCNAQRERLLDFYALLHHWRVCFFDNRDFKSWIAKHPGENPLSLLRMEISPLEEGHSSNSTVDWYESGIAEQDWPWMALEDSRQWRAFQQCLWILQKRGNDVTVLVGSINPHMQTAESLAKCRALREEMQGRLEKDGVSAILLPELPSEEYGDASHPLAAGYRRLADFLVVKVACSDGVL